MTSDSRPNPDELLARVQAEEAKGQRGKLKIFFGAAPGVGKTYAMLEAARKVGKEGIDVVVGYVEPHVRPETQALVLGLDVLPKRRVLYRGRELLDFDLAAGLARRPQIMVVDELAHTNLVDENDALVHAKRWQDVEALLVAGIDVYTTVNVQHLESLNDVVAKITGVIVRETLPDAVFEQADEVELVDIAPDDLIERLQEGKIYIPDQAARAVDHFFNKGNLIALRELALRKMAERVERQMTDWRGERAIQPTWPAAERLLVCVGPGPSSAKLVRATRRMAASLRAPWLVVHVETPRDATIAERDRERLAETLHLARQLGGEIVTLTGTDVAGETIRYARQRNVSKIIVGKTLQPRWRELARGSLVYELTRRSGDIDVYVISGEGMPVQAPAAPQEQQTNTAGYAMSLAVVAGCTLVCACLFALPLAISPVTLSMVYLMGIVIVAARYGRGPSIVASFVGVLAFDFFFVPPHLTFAVHDTEYIFTFLAMLVTGVVISTLTSRLSLTAALARRREQQAAALGELSRALVEIGELGQLHHARDQIEHIVGGEAWVVVSDGQPPNPDLRAVEISAVTLSEQERAVAEWVLKNRQPAGVGTDTLPSVAWMFIPLTASDKLCGVFGVRPRQKTSRFSPEQLRLIEGAAGQLALAVERISSAEAARHIQLRYEREQLRSALLSAVSHDLRTPLTAIAGAGSALADAGPSMTHETRKELADSIVSETDRLNRLISNLLDMTRLESGGMQLDRDWHSLEDIVGAVVRRLARLLDRHRLVVDVPASLPLVYLDELLFHQVLANLIENAVRYTPLGAEIRLNAGVRKDRVWLSISDTGAGFPPGDETRIFEKFYRGAHDRFRSGTGLGLAICRGIVELHGGTIKAANRAEGGAAFMMEIPQPPQPVVQIPAEVAAL